LLAPRRQGMLSRVEKVEAPAGRGDLVTERRRETGLQSEAFDLARAAHAGQSRKDGSPYIGHPQEVTETLAEAGFDDEVLAAALLHDVVEKGVVDIDEVEQRFGSRVAKLVEALTEDPEIEDYVERKLALRAKVEAAGQEAAAIFAADKLANVRDVSRVYSREGEAAGRLFEPGLDARIALWHEDLEMARRAAPDLPFLRDLSYELESLEEQRSGGG
jgi:(p)ppGpp synthase/HD superfamily hydrolase